MKCKVISILTAVVSCLLMANTAFAEIVGNHGNPETSTFSVPEPTTMLLIATGGAALYAVRRLANKRKSNA